MLVFKGMWDADKHPACHFFADVLDFSGWVAIKSGFFLRSRAGSAGEVGRPVEQMALAEVPSWMTPNSPFMQVAVRRKENTVFQRKI